MVSGVNRDGSYAVRYDDGRAARPGAARRRHALVVGLLRAQLPRRRGDGRLGRQKPRLGRGGESGAVDGDRRLQERRRGGAGQEASSAVAPVGGEARRGVLRRGVRRRSYVK